MGPVSREGLLVGLCARGRALERRTLPELLGIEAKRTRRRTLGLHRRPRPRLRRPRLRANRAETRPSPSEGVSSPSKELSSRSSMEKPIRKLGRISSRSNSSMFDNFWAARTSDPPSVNVRERLASRAWRARARRESWRPSLRRDEAADDLESDRGRRRRTKSSHDAVRALAK